MKSKIKSFRIKLWLYFVLFTALIFSVLWILQTIFFQSFYSDMLKAKTREAAEKIVANQDNENIAEIIDELSLTNSALVYVTDNDNNVVYCSNQFKGMNGKMHRKQQEKRTEDNTYERFSENSRENDIHIDMRIIDDFSTLRNELDSSGDGVYENSTDDRYIYMTYFYYGDNGEKYVLTIITMIQAMGSAVDIIRIQLLWGTAISLVTGFVLAWFIAKKFSAPVAALTEKAENIARDDPSASYVKGFCSELDELNDVLDEASKKLKETSDYQKELLANVSHDLRTPLTMIKGYAEMIRDISRNDEQQCGEDVGVIVREADRLTAMVNEILEYSEMQSEGKEPKPERVELSVLLSRVCRNFELPYSRENGTIETDIEQDIVVMGNMSRLERAIYNLLDNAVKHNGNSKLINVSLARRDGNAEIRITDHGKGIPEEELKNIWDRYYTYRQRNKEGVSGLGLAIVRQIVKMHSGSCRAESETGKGSTFIITLPLPE